MMNLKIAGKNVTINDKPDKMKCLIIELRVFLFCFILLSFALLRVVV